MEKYQQIVSPTVYAKLTDAKSNKVLQFLKSQLCRYKNEKYSEVLKLDVHSTLFKCI